MSFNTPQTLPHPSFLPADPCFSARGTACKPPAGAPGLLTPPGKSSPAGKDPSLLKQVPARVPRQHRNAMRLQRLKNTVSSLPISLSPFGVVLSQEISRWPRDLLLLRAFSLFLAHRQ